MENSADITATPVSNIMVVDDDVTFCRVLSNAFSRRGFEVCTVHDSADIIAVAELYVPDAVVLDLRMPGFRWNDKPPSEHQPGYQNPCAHRLRQHRNSD
ncbi:two component Fis family transcriptional regulator [Acidithiobacillus sp. GGI-221]|nr:two component Fis family transcriptional regulator [Acidithiobacillus sp. GGI-221]